MSFRTDTWLNMTQNVGMNQLQNVGCNHYGGSETGQLVSTFMNIGLGVATAALTAKQASSVQNPNAEKSKIAKATISSYSADIAAATGKFNTRYAEFGTSISNNGSVTKSYEQIKTDLDSNIKNLKSSIDADKKANLTKYNNQKAVVTTYEAALSNYQSISTTMTNMESANVGKFTVDGGKATVVKPNAADYQKYVTGDGKPEDTQMFKDELATREAAVKSYNELADSRAKVLEQNKVQDENGLKENISNAQKELETLGEAQVNGSLSVAQYVTALDNANSQLAKLGSASDFQAAIDSVVNIDKAYNDAVKIQQQETRVSESETAVKNDKADLKKAKRGGKSGVRGWFYDITHKDKKSKDVQNKKAIYTQSKQQSDAQKLALQSAYEMYLKEKK